MKGIDKIMEGMREVMDEVFDDCSSLFSSGQGVDEHTLSKILVENEQLKRENKQLKGENERFRIRNQHLAKLADIV